MRTEITDGEGFFLKLLKWALIILAVVGIFALFRVGIEFLKVREVGEEYVPVFILRMTVRLFAGGALFLITFLLSALNGSALRKIASSRGELIWIMKRKFLLPISGVFGLVTAVLCSGGLGEKFLLFHNAVPYGETDPLFGKDISYFFFKRDFYMTAVDILVFVLVLILAYTVFHCGRQRRR